MQEDIIILKYYYCCRCCFTSEIGACWQFTDQFSCPGTFATAEYIIIFIYFGTCKRIFTKLSSRCCRTLPFNRTPIKIFRRFIWCGGILRSGSDPPPVVAWGRPAVTPTRASPLLRGGPWPGNRENVQFSPIRYRMPFWFIARVFLSALKIHLLQPSEHAVNHGCANNGRD